MKIKVKFLKSYGTYAIFAGPKNCGSNFTTDKEAVKAAQKMFPGKSIFVGGFFRQ